MNHAPYDETGMMRTRFRSTNAGMTLSRSFDLPTLLAYVLAASAMVLLATKAHHGLEMTVRLANERSEYWADIDYRRWLCLEHSLWSAVPHGATLTIPATQPTLHYQRLAEISEPYYEVVEPAEAEYVVKIVEARDATAGCGGLEFVAAHQ